MQKYRVRRSPAVIVEAVQLNAENVDEVANWAQAQIVSEGEGRDLMHEALNVKTPNGKERLHPGMYLVKFGKDFFTMAPANFEGRYEPVPGKAPPPSPPTTPTDNPWGDLPRIKDVP